MDGLPSQIAQYEILEGTVDESKKTTKLYMTLTVSNNIHNIALLDKAELIQEYQDGKQTLKRIDNIKFKLSSYALPPKEKKNFTEVENQMMQGDLNILHIKMLSNDLEAYAYDLRNNLDAYGKYEHYIDPAIKPEVLQKVEETVNWIYDDSKKEQQDYE